MIKSLTVLLLGLSLPALAAPASKFVAIDKKVFTAVSPDLSVQPKILADTGSTVVVKLSFDAIENLSHKIHGKLNRCGGFMAFDTFAEARGPFARKMKSLTVNFFDYSIDQQETARKLVDQVSEEQIRKTITELSSFETRHFQSESGLKSTLHIFESWQKLSAHRSDVKVSLYKHKDWPQPTVIMTLEGSDLSDEIVVLGGHADSIALDGEHAPGADDNASGIANVTEVIRLLMSNNVKPRRSIHFMAYAAEEAGIIGSLEVARSYRRDRKKVVGVLQLDMTLFRGSQGKDIFLISDYTSKDQNIFLGKLIDEYVKVPWGYSRCGYGCSDHAPWSALGYPASFPFETSMEDHNPFIHSEFDTLELAGGTADHSVNFAKLAVSYVIEMAN